LPTERVILEKMFVTARHLESAVAGLSHDPFAAEDRIAARRYKSKRGMTRA